MSSLGIFFFGVAPKRGFGGKDAGLSSDVTWGMTGSALTRWTFHWVEDRAPLLYLLLFLHVIFELRGGLEEIMVLERVFK